MFVPGSEFSKVWVINPQRRNYADVRPFNYTVRNSDSRIDVYLRPIDTTFPDGEYQVTLKYEDGTIQTVVGERLTNKRIKVSVNTSNVDSSQILILFNLVNVADGSKYTVIKKAQLTFI